MDLKHGLKRGFLAVLSALGATASWLFALFTRHELWVMKRAMAIPFISIYFFATLWVWWIFPMIPIGVLLDRINDNAVGEVVQEAVTLSVTVGWFIWMARWWLICVSLMFGGRKMAQTRQKELHERLAWLTGTGAASLR